MRRKRRSKGTWLPTIGSVAFESEPDIVFSGRAFRLDLDPGTTIVSAITPITYDLPVDIDDTGTADATMADVVGSEYILRRIVGKCFAVRQNAFDGNGADPGPAVLFGAGFFVARANDDASGGGPDTPIGSATLAERESNYSPLDVDTIREPWIWRRTWLLGRSTYPGFGAPPAGPVAVAATALDGCPSSTMLYGSVMDGPHIDSKSIRRVSQDERLWFIVSAAAFPLGVDPDPTGEVSIRGYLDYRLFGQIRRAHNRGVF